MATSIDFNYGVSFGRGDCSDVLEYSVDVEGKAEAAYYRAKMLHQSLEDVPELEDARMQAYEEVEEEETWNLINFIDDDFTKECVGQTQVDTDRLNDLVHEHDEHALKFFGLTDKTDEEIAEWDADNLSEIPLVCDFEEDYEPGSPFDDGYTLWLEFAEHPEEEYITLVEAVTTLRELFKEANGNYEVIDDYVSRCEDLYAETEFLEYWADSIAHECGAQDYLESHPFGDENDEEYIGKVSLDLTVTISVDRPWYSTEAEYSADLYEADYEILRLCDDWEEAPEEIYNELMVQIEEQVKEELLADGTIEDESGMDYYHLDIAYPDIPNLEDEEEDEEYD